MHVSSKFNRLALLASVHLLSACANAGLGISIPVGPFGSIGVGVNGAGQVSGNIGVGTSLGGVGIGGATSFPIGTVGAALGSTAPINNPSPAPAPTQTGSSQNMPR